MIRERDVALFAPFDVAALEALDKRSEASTILQKDYSLAFSQPVADFFLEQEGNGMKSFFKSLLPDC